MKTIALCLGAVALLVGQSAPPARAAAEDVLAGVAVRDITPPPGYRMSGYFSERLATGTHDPLLAKAVFFRQGERVAALVFCDLIGIPLDLSQAVRGDLRREAGIPIENVLIAATHSHTGPLFAGALRKQFHDEAVRQRGDDPQEKVDYPAELRRKLVEAVLDARAAARPVRLEAGSVEQQGLSFNRRFHMKDGSVRFNPGKLNPDIVRPAGPIDPQVGLLLLRDASAGRPVASLSVFALHLDTIGGTEYAADYPFYLERTLRGKLGPELVSLFGNGTCGDINHIDVGNNRPQKGHGEAQRIGETLGATVAAGIDRLTPIERPSLGVRYRVLDVPLQQFTPEEIAWADEAIKKVGTAEVPFLDRVRAYKIRSVAAIGGKSLPMPVQVFRFGDQTALVALPGELFVDLGLAIKRASPFGLTMVVELAHDAPGYVPTRKAFAEGSYETVNSRVAPGGGEMLVEEAVRLLRELKAEASKGQQPADILDEEFGVRKVVGDCRFTEGPAWGPDGALCFSDGPNDRIMRLGGDGKLSVFRQPCGRANGLAFDRQGRLVWCQSAGPGGGRGVVRLEKDGRLTEMAKQFDGKPFIAPNDLCIDRQGRIYFTDPYYGPSYEKSQPGSAVYRIDAPGRVVRVVDELERPNGIALAPGGRTLYVSDRGTQKLHRYRVGPDGGLRPDGVVYSFAPDRGIDGMALDAEGNIYGAAGQGETTGLFVLSPAGKLLLHKPMPELATNVTFGGKDLRDLYLTATTSVYHMRTTRPGLPLPPAGPPPGDR